MSIKNWFKKLINAREDLIIDCKVKPFYSSLIIDPYYRKMGIEFIPGTNELFIPRDIKFTIKQLLVKYQH